MHSVVVECLQQEGVERAGEVWREIQRSYGEYRSGITVDYCIEWRLHHQMILRKVKDQSMIRTVEN